MKHIEIEGLAAVGMSERRQPDDIARVELETEGGGVGFADNARVFHIGSVNHTYRTGGQEVARYERDGRRAREPGNAAAQCGFKTAADGAGKLLRLFERGFVGNAQAPAIMRRAALRGGVAVEEVARAVDEDEPDAQLRQQPDVGGELV
ncbi:Uncharacterised protein [Neisseria meningitidis]|nr:Uncharacterised protein [Neisseria meningitidis]CWP92841.1 Uncharacterised protein [Neisseria meningitidis]CWQ45163.1 Uncharacterised protein [Neisseria meningitidis]CWS23206.1 Uncharacterised protein [Neisseria meningitidis]CWS38436.1 Uncharacterised protein [Neisseria meningitidis]